MLNKILNTFGTRLLSAMLNLLITILISQFLGPEGKGEQGIIIATIAYILVFVNLMGGSAIVYLVPRFPVSVIILPAYLWTVLTSILFYGFLQLSTLVSEGMIIHVCILSAISAFTTINSSVLIGKEKIAISNLVNFIQPLIITLLLIVFFFYLGKNTIESYIISLYISFSAGFIVSLIYLKRFTDKFELADISSYKTIISNLFRYGLLNQLAHIFQLLSFRMSYYWLEQTYSSAEVGIYSNGTSLVESIWLISRSICLVQYARIANSADLEYSQKLTLQLNWASLIISFIGLLFMVILPSRFFIFLYGEGFGEVSSVIRALAPGVLFFNTALIIGHYFSGIGKYYVNTISSFAGLLFAVLFFRLLIPVYGITGAGWATTISHLITSLTVVWFFNRESKIKLKNSFPSMTDIKLIFSTLRVKK
ncbi:MAG: polysaccharide biosynthesis C-terminal domain-containing protein [Bacteroidales bacterium]|nr:polysaccharide biosynthesis C-terminal domain-containing protein [Bacteroidales bacterium]MDI9592301.1 polysaccharide biosynthesis C-terminal domain-containing protein [Bacteroidota bacterium]OQC37166.1 MAG: Polysaccharide biosynthesis protein [Bacteroidetes bacterium ADurb.Bin041]HOF81899.1 polysaccharide biosynthesis C-terminal domain-containing protein [Bacteroidales bacterium]HOR77139.1 polysaccharide biosynthesis C-terminal domain-containing protein [Bacteroidales bacterium]